MEIKFDVIMDGADSSGLIDARRAEGFELIFTGNADVVEHFVHTHAMPSNGCEKPIHVDGATVMLFTRS